MMALLVRLVFGASVVDIHRPLDALQGKAADHLGSEDGEVGPLSLLLFVKGAEDIVDLPPLGVVGADAKPETGVLRTPQRCLDVLQTVVPAGATLSADAKFAKGDIQVINDDEEVLLRDILLLHPVADGITAEIDVGGGLEEDEDLILDPHLGDHAVALVLKGDTTLLRQRAEDAEAGVVSRITVLGAGIADPHDQVFA